MRKKIASLAVLAVLLALIGRFVWQHQEELAVLLRTPLHLSALLSLLWLLQIFVIGAFLTVPLKVFAIRLDIPELCALSIASAFGNAVLPLRGGIGLRAVYLNRRFGLSYADFTAAFVGAYLIYWNLYSLAGLAALLMIQLLYGHAAAKASFVLAVMFVGTAVPMLAPSRVPPVPWEALQSRLQRLLDGWHLLKSSLPTIGRVCIFVGLHMLLATALLYIEFAALGIRGIDGEAVGIWQALFLAAVGSLSLLITITPASLGIREGILMLTSMTVQISPAHVLAAALLDRAVQFFVLFISAYPAFRLLRRRTETQSTN